MSSKFKIMITSTVNKVNSFAKPYYSVGDVNSLSITDKIYISFVMLFIICIIAIPIIEVPLITIWCLNVLFSLTIEYSFATWFAVIWLCALILVGTTRD